VCHAFYNECQKQAKVHVMLSLAVLGVTVLSITFCIVILGVVMLSFAFLLNKTFFIIMLSAVMLHVVMLSVMAPHNLVKNPIVLANTIWPYRGIFIKSYW
jgi:hypothetical protein